jgi:hypothetical protein
MSADAAGTSACATLRWGNAIVSWPEILGNRGNASLTLGASIGAPSVSERVFKLELKRGGELHTAH